VRLEVGTHLVERLLDAQLRGNRMQPVQQQEVRDQFIVRERLLQPVSVVHGGQRDHAVQALAVQLQQRPHELGRRLPCLGIRQSVDLLE
jgi:hypothetical protein